MECSCNYQVHVIGKCAAVRMALPAPGYQSVQCQAQMGDLPATHWEGGMVHPGTGAKKPQWVQGKADKRRARWEKNVIYYYITVLLYYILYLIYPYIII